MFGSRYIGKALGKTGRFAVWHENESRILAAALSSTMESTVVG